MAQSLSEKLSGIVLPDADGQDAAQFSLGTQPRCSCLPAPLWLNFRREHVAHLREHAQAFKKQGANLAAVGLGDRNYAQLFREETGITFPLLIDEHRLAYRAAALRNANLLHLLRADNKKSRERARTHVVTGSTYWAGIRFSLAEVSSLLPATWTCTSM